MYSGAQTVASVVESPPEGAVGVELRLHEVAAESDLVTSRRPVYMVVKTISEWLLALLLVVTSAPLVLVLAIAIKLTSRGPAFYAQTRLGRQESCYRLFKLRTMVHNAEAKTGPVWAAQDDVRITWLGRLLRDTHLDELPQLINVLRGDMSLIGPRPERPEIATRIENELPIYRNRLAVRPGITGLAQMQVGADDPEDPQLRSVRRKLAHDLFYVREACFMLDLKIAFSTACYFVASAIDSVRRSLLMPMDNAVKSQMAQVLPPEERRR